jgi:hypothetical protein
MKTVVKELPENKWVSFAEINPDEKYYGALLSRDGDPVKGYFRAERYNRDFNLFSVNNFNGGNGFGFNADNLEGSVEKVLAYTDNEVYDFDSLTELFTWLEKK